jgi:hypothetical protein
MVASLRLLNMGHFGSPNDRVTMALVADGRVRFGLARLAAHVARDRPALWASEMHGAATRIIAAYGDLRRAALGALAVVGRYQH